MQNYLYYNCETKYELLQNYEKQIEQKVILQDSKVINSIVDRKIEEIKEMWQKLKESFTWRYKPIVRVRSFHGKF